ncbi:MAG: AMP-binding protein [Spirochaetota bacterium]
MLPTRYVGIIHHPDLKKTDMTCLKLLTSGGASLPVEVLQEFKKLTGVEINEGFGITEISPQTHLNAYKGKKKPGSIGIPYPDTEIKIVDLETGTKEVPVGKPGKMCCHWRTRCKTRGGRKGICCFKRGSERYTRRIIRIL